MLQAYCFMLNEQYLDNYISLLTMLHFPLKTKIIEYLLYLYT